MSEQRTPPSSQPPQRQPGGLSTDDVKKQVDQTLNQLGIDQNIALKVLIVSAVAGVVAALLDEILGLPTGSLYFTFGWFVAALCGPVYAFYLGHDNLAGVISSAVAGAVAFLVWFIVTELIGSEYGLSYGLNVFKAIITGAIVGLVGFGWFAGLRRLPDRILPR
ncbi:MAG: hypothetical protein JXJ20_01675 [Anaerolineae bacterium]|nr:hypothetical protein [Anaerolineae bacterium]